MRKISIIFLAVMFLTSGMCLEPAEAQIIDVCKSGCPHSGIQAAINASSDGDTVRVHDGIYVERINFEGLAITVRSVNGAAETTIDGDGSGTVVTFITAEGGGSVGGS